MYLQSKLLLLLVIIINISTSFQIKLFSFEILLRDNDLTDQLELKESKLFVHINTIFPYAIYEKTSRGSLIPESKNYYFIKIQYSQLSASLQMQKHSIFNASEYQIMYRRLPEVIFFQAGLSEYLQFIRKDSTISNTHFIIKNSTYQNYKQKSRQYSLNFFSLRIDKYLEKCARIAKKELKGKLNEQSLLNFLNLTKYTEEGIKANQSEKNEVVLSYFFDRDVYYQRIVAGQIIDEILIVSISESTLWDIKYDGFGFRFFSAQMIINKVLNADNVTFSQQKIVQLSIIGSDRTRNTRVQKIKQPIQYLKLQSIARLQLCLQGETVHLLLGDNSSFYLIDVSTSLWNLEAHKTNVKFDLLFDNQCRLLYVEQKQIKYINLGSKTQFERPVIRNTDNTDDSKAAENPSSNSSLQIDTLEKQKGRKIIPKTSIPIVRQVTKVQLKETITSIHKLHSYTIICQQNNKTSQQCFLYKKNLHFPPLKTFILQPGEHSRWSQFKTIQDDKINHIISYRINEINLHKFIQVFQQSIIKNKNNTIYSQIFGFIYPFEDYLNKSICREHQMDKMIFNHLQTLRLQKNYHLPLIPDNFYQFSLLLSKDQQVCYNFSQNQSQQLIMMKAESNWTICPIKQITKGLSQIDIESNSSAYKMFACQISLDNYSDSNYICVPYIPQQNPKNKHLINGNRMIKFYSLRLESQRVFPTIYFTDIDKQQIIFASNVFFILMLVLSISFLLLVLFIVLKPLLVAVLIYYGWRQDFSAPTYPLTWIQLKIKIKRLVQMKFLKYVPHDPIIQTQDNHCCFCLENLLRGNKVAQLYCRHEFHKECFDQWVKNEPSLRCPTCRRQFTRQKLNEFQSSQELLD